MVAASKTATLLLGFNRRRFAAADRPVKPPPITAKSKLCGRSADSGRKSIIQGVSPHFGIVGMLGKSYPRHVFRPPCHLILRERLQSRPRASKDWNRRRLVTRGASVETLVPITRVFRPLADTAYQHGRETLSPGDTRPLYFPSPRSRFDTT